MAELTAWEVAKVLSGTLSEFMGSAAEKEERGEPVKFGLSEVIDKVTRALVDLAKEAGD